jgi:Txe/YoeB family toxin of Txe-Axe toxin-antitoxin module
MATATVTISRATPADTKPIVPLASHEGSFRYSAPQINTLQHIQATAAAFGQPGHAHSVSDGNHVQHDSISPQQNKVAITTPPQSLASHQSAALAPNPSSNANVTRGPTSGAVIIPPRPKPGRKPLPQEHAQDRRRVQNRQAQRNFRDKRAQKVSELTADNERIRRDADDMHKQFTNRINDQKQRNFNLVQENERLKKELDDALRRADDAERQVYALDVTNRFNNAGFPNGGLQKVGSSTAMPPMPSSLTGPVDAHLHASGVPVVMAATVAPRAERANNTGANNTGGNEVFEHEIDMNNLWNNMTGKPNKTKPVTNNKYAPEWLGSNMDVDQEGSCGFCTDESNCACIQSQKPQPVIAPGGCDACVRDPQRAAACKAFAERAEVSQRPAQNTIQNGNIDQRNDSMAPPSGMVSCSNLIDQVGLQRMPSIAELFPGKFHAYPVTSGSGYDVNEQEAAQVLQSMSRRNTIAGAAGAHL